MKRTFLKTFILIALFWALSPETQAQVEYIAHRGASYLAPENTLASAKLAWESGADAVEVDIHLSKDGKIIVMHDSSAKRTTGQDFKIKETDSAQLRKLDNGSYKDAKYKGEKIPFLEEEFDLIPPGKKLVIELKSRGNVFPELKKMVEKCGKKDQLVFICFDWETIVETKKLFPDNKCYWLSGKKDELMGKFKLVAENKLDGVDLSNSIIDKEVMDEAGKLKLDVIAYTVDDPIETKRLIGLGVKGITTNRPGWLKTQVDGLLKK